MPDELPAVCPARPWALPPPADSAAAMADAVPRLAHAPLTRTALARAEALAQPRRAAGLPPPRESRRRDTETRPLARGRGVQGEEWSSALDSTGASPGPSRPSARGPAGCPRRSGTPVAAQPPRAQAEPPAREPTRGRRAETGPRPQMPYRLAPACTDIKVFASSCWRLTNPPVCFVYAIFFPPTWAFLMLWAFCKHFKGSV